MTQHKPIFALLCVVVSTALAAGCGEKKTVAAESIYYPAAPDPPRLQFLMTFSHADHWVESSSSFADFIVGKREKPDTRIKTPYGIRAANGKLYICDLAGARVHVIDVAGKSYGVLGRRGQLKRPVHITIAPDGTKYVCDTSLRKVAVFNARDKFVKYLGDPRTCNPVDLAIYGDELIVADITGAEVEVWGLDGKFRRLLARKGQGPGELQMPTNVTVSPSGQIYVADTVASIINVYDIRGHYLRSVGAPGDRPGFFARPKGIAIDPKGIVYTTDAQWEMVQIFDPAGRLLLYFGGASPKPEGMGMPAGITVDRTSLPAFQKYVDKDFRPEYLVFVTNQFGNNKIGVYAFGRSATAKYPKALRKTATRPPTSPPKAKTPDKQPPAPKATTRPAS